MNIAFLGSTNGLPSTQQFLKVKAHYLVNKSHAFAMDYKTPEETWSGNPPKYSNFRVFGHPSYVHVRQEKLEQRAKKCIFLG